MLRGISPGTGGNQGAVWYSSGIVKRLRGKDFLSISDLRPGELRALLDLADGVKRTPKKWRAALSGVRLALLFEKPSLRTRVTFEVAAGELGGDSIFLSPGEVGLGIREPVKDVARNLERWVQGIVARVFRHATLQELARYADVPVVNALCDLEHPCQILADLQTLRERWGSLAGRRIAWLGDGNNVCHSLLLGAAMSGMSAVAATPKGYEPKRSVVAHARKEARRHGAEIALTSDPEEAVAGADAVYTDVWASMGQESEKEARAGVFHPYRVSGRLMRKAARGALFLHCLPAHRGEEVQTEVLESRASVVFDQAENRLHAQKAVLLALFGAA